MIMRSSFPYRIASWVTWCTVSAVFSLATLGAQTRQTVIQAGTIIDGKGGVFKNRQIVIRGSKIASGLSGDGILFDPVDYDLSKLTVMPGWIDTHVHLTWHFDAKHQLVNGREDPK